MEHCKVHPCHGFDKMLPRSPLLSYVQVLAPCQFALPHRAMALGCQASIFGFVLSYDQHHFLTHPFDLTYVLYGL